ncbi:MAG: zinc ribbon domain-containing protein [Deltaproteobacteria bacterium]|nr:zinc ribbon domain-containing protein [Deltaproteobacteria bacterium]
MRHCTKCGKEVKDSWKFCLACGAEVPDDPPPPDARADGIAAPPVMRPPEPSEPSSATPGGLKVARLDLEIPRYRGGQAPAGKPGARPALLIAVAAAVALAGAVGVFLLRGSDAGESGSSGRAEPPVQVQTASAPQPPPAVPAEPVGTIDRALLEAELAARQAAGDLKRELREEWEAAGTEPDPAAGRSARPDPHLVYARIEGVREAIYACAAGRNTDVSAKVTFEGATGRVTAATAEGDLPAEARECIVEVLRGMSVPAFADPSVTIDFTLPVGTP